MRCMNSIGSNVKDDEEHDMKRTAFGTASLAAAITIGLVMPVEQLSAAVFAKYDGIDGESTDAGHKDWIDVLSWSWELDQNCRHVVSIEKPVDAATPKIQQAIVDETLTVRGIIELISPDPRTGEDFTKALYDFSDVQFLRSTISADETGTEQVEFSFGSASGEVFRDYGGPSTQVSIPPASCKGKK